jgi:Domain of unknown function (DUF1844)
MEREEEKPKAYKVDDRRRFSSEGDLKPEFREDEAAAAKEAEQPAPASAAPEAGVASPPSASEEAAAHIDSGDQHHSEHPHQHDHGDPLDHAGHDHTGHDHRDHAHDAGQAAEITFGTFLVSLSTQALMLLGDIPDPQGGRPQQDLVAAQQLIDIIGMLEQKTHGNLDREEAQLIDAILYELRMKYVERARTAR